MTKTTILKGEHYKGDYLTIKVNSKNVRLSCYIDCAGNDFVISKKDLKAILE